MRLYEHLFTAEDPTTPPAGSDNWHDNINADSLAVVHVKVEPALRDAVPGEPIQFERTGYFTADTKDSTPDKLVFNRTVTLKDSWAKMNK